MNTFQPRLDVLPKQQQQFWPQMADVPHWFTLYGGTALALRLGHRVSVDFDFFSSESFAEEELRTLIPFVRDAQVLQRGTNTLTVHPPNSSDIKISFFGGLTIARVNNPDFDQHKMTLVASLDDLAATKLAVITRRAAARDYLDVAALLNHGMDLSRGLACARAVYRNEFDPMLGLKALSYFGDLPDLPKDISQFLAHAATQVSEIDPVQPVSDRLTPEPFRKHKGVSP